MIKIRNKKITRISINIKKTKKKLNWEPYYKFEFYLIKEILVLKIFKLGKGKIINWCFF